MFKLIRKKGDFFVKKLNVYIVVLLLMLILVGMYSSLKFKYQTITATFSDLIIVCKFLLVYLLSESIFNYSFIEEHSEKISSNTKFIIIVFFILTILNYIFHIWPLEYRFGIMPNKLFYPHPTFLASSCIFLSSLLVLTQNGKLPKTYLAMVFMVLVSTLRFKAIGAAIVVLFLLIYIYNSNKKISISKLGLVAIVILLIAWDQISYYYIEIDGSARKVLNETSVKIAKDYFPIGTGFGTFGSYYSAKEYSPIYALYGIDNVYGLTVDRSNFVSDTFWPMIIGQFGIIGTISYIIIIFIIFKKIQNEFSVNNKNIYIAKLICFVYLLISSTSEAAFVNTIAIPFSIIIGIRLQDERKEEK